MLAHDAPQGLFQLSGHRLPAAGLRPRRAHVRIVLSTTTTAIDLHELARTRGALDAAIIEFLVPPGVVLTSNSPSTPTVSRGAFPASRRIILRNYGTIRGKGGNAGAGNGGSGGSGGTAVDASAGVMTIDNRGSIAGGSGGSGGQGVNTTLSATCPGPNPSASGAAGADGGGTAGGSGPNGDEWYDNDSPNGDCRFTAGAGGAGGSGGAAGKYVNGNANVRWRTTGTLLGAVA